MQTKFNFATRYSLLATRYSLLATRYSLLALMCFLTITLHAQTENSLFTPIKLPKKMNDEQTTMVTKIEKYPDVTNVQYITVNDYAKFVQGGYLVFTIPNEINPVKAKIKRAELQKNGDYVLYAIFENSFDDILLVKEKEKVFGTMSYGANSYRIYGIGKNLSALMTLDGNKPKGQCGNDGKDESHIKIPTTHANAPEVINPCIPSPVTSVLCLFTVNANNVDPNINQTAVIAGINFNNALTNSAVSSNNARIVISGIALLQDFIETGGTGGISIDVGRISSDNRPNIGAQALRNTFHADVVVLLTNGQYDYVGWTQQISAEDATSYVIAQVTAAVNNKQWTFSHELGHVFGSRHETGQDNTAGDAHAYEFVVRYGFLNLARKTYNTVMHTQNGNDRILQFSNPEVTFRGYGTGRVAYENNARVISENAFRISNFRSDPPLLNATVLGNSYILESGYFCWEPSISCGVAPYTTTWDVLNPYGQTFLSSTVPNDGQLCLDFYPYSQLVQFGYITIRMTVHSSDNQETVSFMNVYIDGSGFPMSVKPIDNANKSNLNIKTDGSDFEQVSHVFPSPANSTINFDFILNQEIEVSLSIYNSQGKEVKSTNLGLKPKGYNRQEIQVSDLNSGMYLYRLSTKGSYTTQKFSVMH